MEALLQSNLECFYSQTCFDELKSYLNVNVPLNASIMNPSALIQFSTKSTIADILDELMVEKWSWSLTYEDYFEECSTLQCSYTILTRNDAIYILTTVISVIGGLVTALKQGVPRVVRLFRRQRTQTNIERGNKVFQSRFYWFSTFREADSCLLERKEERMLARVTGDSKERTRTDPVERTNGNIYVCIYIYST